MTKQSINKQLWIFFCTGIAFEMIGIWFNKGNAQYFAGMFIGYAIMLVKYKDKLTR